MAYAIINKIFTENGEFSAAEAHGIASGMLCTNDNAEFASWLAQLLPGAILTDEDKTQMQALFEQTKSLLACQDNSFSYHLFLPDDDQPLTHRIEALRDWCIGFLFAIGCNRAKQLDSESREIVQDIIEFSKLDSEIAADMDAQDSQEHETALMEIQEYLKTAIMILQECFLSAGKADVAS